MPRKGRERCLRRLEYRSQFLETNQDIGYINHFAGLDISVSGSLCIECTLLVENIGLPSSSPTGDPISSLSGVPAFSWKVPAGDPTSSTGVSAFAFPESSICAECNSSVVARFREDLRRRSKNHPRRTARRTAAAAPMPIPADAPGLNPEDLAAEVVDEDDDDDDDDDDD
jgi:hypothetical protein